MLPPVRKDEMELELRYSGPAVDDGQMSAKELGPALFGMAEVLEAASDVLFGEPLRVDVRGNFKRGSFAVHFVTATGGDIISTLDWEKLSFIATSVGVGWVLGKDALTGLRDTVIGLVKWIRGRKVEKTEDLGDGEVRVTVTGGENVTINVNTFNVWRDPRVREGLAQIADPLRSEGIDAVEVGPPGEPAERIEKPEARYFAVAPLPDAEPTTETTTAYLEVIGPNFREGNKWRFDAAGVSFHARIIDEAFLERVKKHEYTFGRGDVLKVRMEIERRARDTERTILKVLDYLPGASSDEQTSMALEPPPVTPPNDEEGRAEEPAG